jgi:hypothetical protein
MYEDASGNMQQFTLYDNISEFIQTYEENRKNKKKIKDDKLAQDIIEAIGDVDESIE